MSSSGQAGPAGTVQPSITGATTGNAIPPPAPHQHQPATQQNLNQIVIEYLNKKGYARTEAVLRQESGNVDANGRVQVTRAEDQGGRKYSTAYYLLWYWIEDTLELYKVELKRLLWPVFVYSFLSLIADFYPELARKFFDDYSKHFSRERADDLEILGYMEWPEHIDNNTVARAYRHNKYRLTLTHGAYQTLIQFLEAREKDGGSVILSIIQNGMTLVTTDRASAGSDRAFAAIMERRNTDDEGPEEDEGIPGHNPGSANTDRNAPPVLTRLSLGPLPMETDQSVDVRDELEEEDAKNPPAIGKNALIDELDQRIKREPSEDAPSRDNVPLPKTLARDVAMEVQKIKENRDRFKIGARSGGVGPGISVTMFTFHNTFDSVNCIDFSGDNTLVAVGTAESYIRVWSLEGKALPSVVTDPSDPSPITSSSRRLIGHSGPVYAVSFSPSIANDEPNAASTNCRYILSASADKSVRLWSLDTWSCLVVYKGHDHPVWDVTWGPFGHYFLTGSHDHTARLWSTDHVAPLRIFAGHDQDVDCVAFHPNNGYVFTGSSDKTVRMWDVSRGSAVRIFTSHTAPVTCVACAPSGKTLASADDAGTIFLWDLASGRRVKRMRGHGKGGIWSLSWSVESSLLVSGGADNTVRVWDVLQQTEGAAANKVGEAITASKVDGTGINVAGGIVGGAGKKGKAKDATVSQDQISAFPTKKTPVYKVGFTNMNLVLVGGAYMP